MSALEGIADPSAPRLLKRYIWAVRVSMGVALSSAVGFLFVVRSSVFTPDSTNWPLIACVILWVASMATALWARGRIRSMGRTLRAGMAGKEPVSADESRP